MQSSSLFCCWKVNVTLLFQEIQRQKIEYQLRIPDEPPPDHPEAVHIVIKLPNGMRLERRFLQDDSLEVTACSVLYLCICICSFYCLLCRMTQYKVAHVQDTYFITCHSCWLSCFPHWVNCLQKSNKCV